MNEQVVVKKIFGTDQEKERSIVFKKDSKNVVIRDSACTHQTFILQDNADVVIMDKPKITEKSRHITIVAGKGSKVLYTLALQGSADVSCKLISATGSTIDIRGIYIGSGDDQIAITTEQMHPAPQSHSSILFKGLLTDAASSIYKGIIVIRENAAGSNADQSHQAILTSSQARSLSVPALEILTDDVQCKHGSATGPFDDQLIFYLMNRGFSLNQARALLIKGFFAEVFSQSLFSKNFYANWIDEQIREVYE